MGDEPFYYNSEDFKDFPEVTSQDGETYTGIDTVITYDNDGEQHVEVIVDER